MNNEERRMLVNAINARGYDSGKVHKRRGQWYINGEHINTDAQKIIISYWNESPPGTAIIEQRK